MTHTHVALLRGINVGGGNRVEMKKLKTTFEHLGYTDVRTYINSGNVIFKASSADTAALASTIEKAILKDFGLSIKTIVCSQKTIEKIHKAIPTSWTNDTNMKSDVMFLWDDIDSASIIKELDPQKGIDTVIYVAGAVLWSLDRTNYSRSSMHDIIGTKLYKSMTVRNVNTVRKLYELMKED